jgi:hypothetical protein
MFAAIPLLFAAQQATEGLVWLTVDGSHGTLNRIAATVFLGIALIIWPVWTPLSLEVAERNAGRRSRLRALCWAGVGVAVGASVLLATRAPSASVAGHSIRYDFAEIGPSPLHGLSVLAYVASTALPWFTSTIRWGRALGSALVLSCVLSALIQKQTLTSVWCFFAAVLSGLILFVVEREQRARQSSLSTEVRGEAKAAGHS